MQGFCLSKVLQRLVKEKLLNSVRGPGGGFSLERGADSITLLDVYQAIEGAGSDNKCPGKRKNCKFSNCIFMGIPEKLDKEFEEYLRSRKVSDF